MLLILKQVLSLLWIMGRNSQYCNIMEEIRRNNSVYFQEKLHHRQQLRQQILPETIDMLQINQNPSTVSRKACQSLYQDQLEKQIDIRNSLKNQDNRQSQMTLNEVRNKNKSNSAFHTINTNSRQNSMLKQFRDYEKQKYNKINQHVNMNLNGGTAFYKQCQLHQNMQQRNLKDMGQTLKTQLNHKMKQLNRSKDTKQMQLKIRQYNLSRIKLQIQQQKQHSHKQKQIIRKQYLQQIQQQRTRKQTSQKFNYNPLTRHNPITNPIQYHIDNPYILKQIQQQQHIR